MVYSRSVLLACSKIACQRKLSVLGGSRRGSLPVLSCCRMFIDYEGTPTLKNDEFYLSILTGLPLIMDLIVKLKECPG